MPPASRSSTQPYIALWPSSREKTHAPARTRSDLIGGVRRQRDASSDGRDTARRVMHHRKSSAARYWIWIWSITAVAVVTVDDESLAVITSLRLTVLPANADRSRLVRTVKLDSLYDVKPEIALASTM